MHITLMPICKHNYLPLHRGSALSRVWSGGAKVLGKLPVPGRPTNLDSSRPRASCACRRCGWGLCGHFFSCLSLLFSFSLPLGDGPIWTEILSQRAVKPKTTNQPALSKSICFNLLFSAKAL